MTQIEVIERLQPIFDDLFLNPVELTSELKAEEVPEWDSLTQISLLMAIESRFKIRFRVGEVERTRSVGELADLIAQHAALSAPNGVRAARAPVRTAGFHS
jgi:acyl carrier protein